MFSGLTVFVRLFLVLFVLPLLASCQRTTEEHKSKVAAYLANIPRLTQDVRNEMAKVAFELTQKCLSCDLESSIFSNASFGRIYVDYSYQQVAFFHQYCVQYTINQFWVTWGSDAKHTLIVAYFFRPNGSLVVSGSRKQDGQTCAMPANSEPFNELISLFEQRATARKKQPG